MHSMGCCYDGSNSESASTAADVGNGCLVFNVQNFHLAVIRNARNLITLVNVFHSHKDSAFDFTVLKTAPFAFLSPYYGCQPLAVPVTSSEYGKRVTFTEVCANRMPVTSLSIVTKSGWSIIACMTKVRRQPWCLEHFRREIHLCGIVMTYYCRGR
jgi:hypothetical protein